ncbi:hypothetical protein H7I57_10740 [Mycobacterium pyrenivorans]|nr:hypothetical protein [Mycolicibacterium pyrenivorans]MCV7151748.1 hypothetical protein [Mycolicibacterium pyrenivorans]
MSWLLVALIPGLLMLATFGLERVESSLRRDSISAADVAGFLDQAEASDVDALARDGMGTAMHGLRRRLDEQSSTAGELGEHIPARGLPTRQYIHHRVHQDANPEFQQTRHANPV